MHIFERTLGIEVNNGFLRMGYRRLGRLCGLTRVDAPVADGEIQKREALRGLITEYVTANGTGRRALITINTTRAVMRLAAAGTEPEAVFPMDMSGYVLGRRMVDTETMLMCCIPAEVSDGFALLMREAGLKPLTLSVHADSVSLALERTGKNAVCVTDGLIIYIENGRLKELLPVQGSAERNAALSAMGGAVIDLAYDLSSDGADIVSAQAGPYKADELALRGLLEVVK